MGILKWLSRGENTRSVNGVTGVMTLMKLLALMLAIGMTTEAVAQRDQGTGGRQAATVDRHAKHLFDKAIELMEYKQYERGLAMLDNVIRDNPGNILGYRAHMAKGRHFQDQRKSKEALSHFLLLSKLLAPVPGAKVDDGITELYRESLYQAGLSYYQSGQYSAAFPMFRRLTEVAGKSKWANLAYYHIGMSHYNLKNWNKAIDNLSLVGTEIDDSGDQIGRIEIGQRFYAKITDADIPVLRKIGKEIKAKVTVSSGDSEVLTAVPVAGKKHEALTSAPTQIGKPKPGDGVLQMLGGDTLNVTYLDKSTMDGKKDVPRKGKVLAVSTGTIGFFLGDYSTPAYIAFPGQPQALMLRDADLDKSPRAEKITVTVKAFFKVANSNAATADQDDILDIFAERNENEDIWKERDSVTLTLTETQLGKLKGNIKGKGPIRTGVFTNKVKLALLGDNKPDLNDDILHCEELDELEVTYVDKVHLYGEEPRESKARIKVSGSVNSGVTADQYVVFEAILKARKNAVEAEALKGLGEIYKDMGLDERANQRANEALKKINTIILDRKKIPSELLERAFKLKWESEILKEDFKAATATCQAFNRLYPESVLADQAMMALSQALAEKGDYDEAVKSYQRVLALKNPISAAQAQYRIGEVLQMKVEKEFEGKHGSRWTDKGLTEKSARQRAMSGAIAAYRKTYQTYPESAYAADALQKVVRFYVETDDFAQASDLLEQVFADFPDSAFLDEMLLLWARVAFRMGDNELAQSKLRQLIFDYPSSKHITEAQKRLAALKSSSSPK